MNDTVASRPRYRLAELSAKVGQVLGESGWRTVSQREIDLFAEATGDFAPIHVDAEAARRGPYGQTVAHGFLTLALVAPLTEASFEIEEAGELINYGVNRCRFPAPLLSRSRVRLSTTLTSLEHRSRGTVLTLAFELSTDASGRPVAVGETLLLVIPREANP